MAGGDNSTVKITINVVDANSGQVISTVTKNMALLGGAGTKAGAQIAQGAQAGTVALKATGDAGAVMGKALADGGNTAAASLDTVTAAATRVQEGMAAIPVGIEAAAKRTRTAGSEMQQMLDNIQRSQKKLEQANLPPNAVQALQRKSSSPLGESFAGLGTVKGEMDNLGQSFTRMGDAGANAGKKASAGLAATGGHATTSLDKVRLLSQEFGLRLPRALETMLSRMPGVMSAIGALGGAVAGLAIAEVVYRAGTALYDLQQKFLSATAPAKEFFETLKKTSELDFTNTRTLATTQARSDQAAYQSQLQDKVSDKQSDMAMWHDINPVNFVSDLMGAHTAAVEAVTAKDRMIKLAATEIEQTHAQAIAQIELNHALDGTLSRRAQTAAATRKTAETEIEKNSYNRKLELNQGNYSPRDAGQAESNIVNQQAQREAAVQTIALNQEVSSAIMRSRDAAAQAGMQGEALYRRKQSDAVKELTAELIGQHMAEEIPARTRALNEQYDRERLGRLRELTAETKRGTSEVNVAATKGIQHVLAERDQTVGNIGAAEQKFSGGAPISAEATADFQQQRVNAARTATKQIEQLEEQFADRIRDMDAARSDSTMSASERIDAANRRTAQEIFKAWDELYGKLGAADQRRVQSYAALQGELGRIAAEGEREKRENRRGIEDETQRMEAEAGRRGMTREQEEAQAVLDEYRERFQHLEELRGKDAANGDLYRRQEIAAEEIKNGKLIEQQRAMRDKLAGVIRGYMNNPLEALKKTGEEAASKYAADLLLKATNRGAGPGNAAGSAPAGNTGFFGMAGGLLHGGATHKAAHEPGSAGAVVSRKPEQEAGHPSTVAASSSVSSASTELRTGTATIYVQSATFATMPGGAGAALPASTVAAGGGSGVASGLGLPSYTPASGSASGPVSVQAPATSEAGLSSLSALQKLGGPGSATGDAGSGSAGGTGSTAGGVISKGGPAVAAALSSLGQGDDDAKPAIFTDMTGMGQKSNELSKSLGLGDLGGKAQGGLKKLGISESALGKAGGALGGAAGLFGAIESNGGFGGALSGALSGAKLGGMLGGPIGAGIGAAAGAIVGFLGFGGANKAKEYNRKEVKPRIDNDLRQFRQGGLDYSSAWEDLVKLDKEARHETSQLGQGGKREWDNAIHPEIMKAQQTLTREQKAGRSKYGETAAQFHNGGIIGDFGSMATSGDQGWVHAQKGEFMVQQQAVPSHYQALQLMQSGASHSDMADYYGAGARGGVTTPAATGRDVHLNFHSHDAQGAMRLFMDNKHVLREALDQSYLENSGGANA